MREHEVQCEGKPKPDANDLSVALLPEGRWLQWSECRLGKAVDGQCHSSDSRLCVDS